MLLGWQTKLRVKIMTVLGFLRGAIEIEYMPEYDNRLQSPTKIPKRTPTDRLFPVRASVISVVFAGHPFQSIASVVGIGDIHH